MMMLAQDAIGWCSGSYGLLALALIVVAMIGVRIVWAKCDDAAGHSGGLQAALDSQEMERQRIARDLHDGIGQSLAAAALNLSILEELITCRGDETADAAGVRSTLSRVIGIVAKAGSDVRALSHGLGTSTLRDFGLEAAVAEMLEGFPAGGATRFELIVLGLDEAPGEAIETGMFRITQELVTNAARHASATEITVQIVRIAGGIALTVEDDGVGFDTSRPGGGMGRRNIEARVEALGGVVHFDSTRGHGSTVTVVAPYHGPEATLHAISVPTLPW
jgi:two-component system, NarL family, sensor kinase